jgi:hypothetical protein
MTTPLVSYIVTVFNKQDFLPFVIAALQTQRGDFDREFIFVDDGSTDDSCAVIEAAFDGDDRLRLIRQVNQGPSAATNVGIAAARGIFVKPVDGDDVLAPWATATLLDAAEQTGLGVAFASPKRAGLYSPVNPVGSVLEMFTPESPSVRETDLLSASLRNAQTNPTCWMAKRQLVNAVGGCDPAFFIQDYSIELRLAAAGSVAEIDAELFKAPIDPAGRASANEAQILHDMNGALVNFLIEYADRLPADLRRLGMNRATGRAWLWAKRHGGGGYLSAAFGYRMRARLGMLQPSATVRDRLGRTFRETGSVRVPVPLP